ncbi:hypothetical protein B0H16DRAFT_1414953 [Mycena metata]|uniref:Integrase core domain-containing protein n=1 Tax=Mycena metata TaxID=1033252 RepID=A0AAD7JCE5_9AGAR|nr:hypothetical protein B0H16DRAFT_1414953 [Mycena metata]
MSHDNVHHFLMEAHHIAQEAQFIIDSLPNAETPAVERVTHQLSAIRTILSTLDDPHSDSRLWRDIRKDTLESFRQIFIYLTANDLLDMDNDIHRSCLYLVFQPRIQASLDRTRDAWNHHKIRTAKNKTPVALYELSREAAIARGYWTGDPGDDIATVANDPLYAYDGEAPLPPAGENAVDPENVRDVPVGIAAEREAGIAINDDDELNAIKELMPDFNFDEDDNNWGIDVYCRAVVHLSAIMV